MVREFEGAHTDNLLVVLDPEGLPAGALESAVSLAATACWEWCRQRGDWLALGAGGPQPDLITGVTGQPLALRLLERLAVQPEGATGRAGLLEVLTRERLPRAGVLLVTGPPDGFADELARRLGRPVAPVDATDLASAEFYEGPAHHDA